MHRIIKLYHNFLDHCPRELVHGIFYSLEARTDGYVHEIFFNIYFFSIFYEKINPSHYRLSNLTGECPFMHVR